MEGVKEDRRKYNGGPRRGAGRKTMRLVDRRLQRRVYCTQEEFDWLLEKLDERRQEHGERPRSKRNDASKKRIL